MTVKELMQISGKDRSTIIGKIKELLPDYEIKERKKIILNDEQVDIILNALPVPSRIQQISGQKITRVLHLTQRHDVKYDLSAGALEKLSKIMSDEELKEYIHHVMDLDTRITGSQEIKKLKKPDEDEESEEEKNKEGN